MKQWIKKWGGVGLFLVLFLAALGGFIWFTSRPVELRAEDGKPDSGGDLGILSRNGIVSGADKI